MALAVISIMITVAALSGSSSAQLEALNMVAGGVVSCSTTTTGSAAIPNAPVDLVCGSLNNAAEVVGSGVTNANGVYRIIANNVKVIGGNGTITDGDCYLNVTIPANSCSVDAPAGMARFPVIPLIDPVTNIAAGSLPTILFQGIGSFIPSLLN